MHRLYVTATAVLLFPAARMLAQSDSLKASRDNAGIVLSALLPSEHAVLAIAAAMPADKYDFVPTAGRFAGTRSFAEQLKHIAADLYLDGGAILGDQLRGNITREEAGDPNVHTKEQVVAYVRDAFAYVERAVRTIDDATELPTGRTTAAANHKKEDVLGVGQHRLTRCSSSAAATADEATVRRIEDARRLIISRARRCVSTTSKRSSASRPIGGTSPGLARAHAA